MRGGRWGESWWTSVKGSDKGATGEQQKSVPDCPEFLAHFADDLKVLGMGIGSAGFSYLSDFLESAIVHRDFHSFLRLNKTSCLHLACIPRSFQQLTNRSPEEKFLAPPYSKIS